MTWKLPATAPTGIKVRVALNVIGGRNPGLRELCYEMVKREDGRWCYARTMVPVFPWHEPVVWTDQPRTPEQQVEFNKIARDARGSNIMPSADRYLFPIKVSSG